MKNVSFKQFLHTLNEGTAEDVARLQAEISTIDTQVSQRTAPLNQRKMQLQKLLMQKQKLLQAEQARNEQPGSVAQPPTTKTPGGTGSGTPGSDTQ